MKSTLTRQGVGDSSSFVVVVHSSPSSPGDSPTKGHSESSPAAGPSFILVVVDVVVVVEMCWIISSIDRLPPRRLRTGPPGRRGIVGDEHSPPRGLQRERLIN